MESSDQSKSDDELRGAYRLGRQFCQDFGEEYVAFFFSRGDGASTAERQIAGHHERRLGFSSSALTEYVMDVIHAKRTHYRNDLFAKLQESAFLHYRIQRNLLPGYFRNVASCESKKLPGEMFGGRPYDDDAHGDLLADEQWSLEPDVAQAGPSLRQLLVEFWGEAKGFTNEERWEGLVSAALGELIVDQPEISRDDAKSRQPGRRGRDELRRAGLSRHRSWPSVASA